MNIAIVGTGYVGLVTGSCLAEIGHQVTCLDTDRNKVARMSSGISPIHEPGLEELMKKNIDEGKLFFTTDYNEGIRNAEVIYIAVGTPQNSDGTPDLTDVKQAARDIAVNINKNAIVVTKSTVSIGTTEYVKELIQSLINDEVKIDVVHNPEFLREGSAIHDTFYGDRIVIGAENHQASSVLKEINSAFGIPVFVTDIRNAEMIKYASNAFLATKISFINEIANICEKVDANVEEVAYGMGLDKRIGHHYLQAGIGYGGSCFPKDTSALVHLAGGVEHDFELLKAVIRVNNHQQISLVDKAKKRLGSLKGKKVAVLGLAYKPDTDDVREAASLVVVKRLLEESAFVTAFDPYATENAKQQLPKSVFYTHSIKNALDGADIAFILTEWDEIKRFSLSEYETLMKHAIVFDGRNCFPLEDVKDYNIEYYSIGRQTIL
ncbi:UDP-glucose/GDP-mannose dehydrogenase family protein [Pontibacillus sp. HMF3514]|uniref:UDP-glucose dehydrogenase family protein n=1 Tax=Pontibacillus sp. HMF3514 TaxID=2692425 RepID=UPI00131FC277|nr:UDP-glucose/GDP-mannose dehydrogenase family protein [Pontibacillus sp. HMF3514]QHE50933.1 nucleotide sugar dehydrogenase [Pontibacillus sp. HMF3514]